MARLSSSHARPPESARPCQRGRACERRGDDRSRDRSARPPGGRRRTRRRRGRHGDRPPPGTREAAGPRADRPAPRPRLGVPGAEPARRRWDVRRRGAERGHRHRDRPGRGDDLPDRRQRRDGQGWDLLPDHRQEAPPGAGDRAREPAAVRLPGRQRRRLPPAPGRRLPRPRPLRADLLQPGPAVGGRDPPDRARDGLVDGRRGVCAGDERRDGDRPRDRDDLPRRTAAREGGHRRGRQRRGPGRLRGSHPDQRRRGPRGARRRARPRARPLDRRQPEPTGARTTLGAPASGAAAGSRARRSGGRPRPPLRGDPGRPPAATGDPRGHRPARRRRASSTSSSRCTARRS